MLLITVPTFDEVWDQAKILIHALQEMRELASVDGTNLAGLEDDYQSVLKGEYTPNALATWRRTFRSPISQALSPATVIAILSAFALELARVIGKPQRTPQSAAVEVRDYMHANGEWIPSRGISHGTPSAAGGNTGDGELFRLVVDRHGHELEGVFLENKLVTVLKDQNSVTIHQEVLGFSGEAAERDFLLVDGSGMGSNRDDSRHHLVGTDARLTESFVTNPSWDTHTGTDDTAFATGGADAPSGWNVDSDWANFKPLDAATHVFRGSQGVTTPWGLECTASDRIYQVLRSDGPNPRFKRNSAYMLRVKIKRLSAATGFVELQLGGVTEIVNLAGLSTNAWVTLQIGTTTPKDSWFRNFVANDLHVGVSFTSISTGTVAFDDLCLTEYKYIDGTYWAATGGGTPWVVDDTLSFTDALDGTDAVIQYWWSLRAALVSLPHVAPATQVVADGTPTMTFNDNGGSNDTVVRSAGSFISDGYKVGMTLTVAGGATNDGTYTILAVVALTIDVATASFSDEGPLSGSETLDATAPITDP